MTKELSRDYKSGFTDARTVLAMLLRVQADSCPLGDRRDELERAIRAVEAYPIPGVSR